jgi:hypothetical protein
MFRTPLQVALLLLVSGTCGAAPPMRFWNMASETVVDLRLAPSGTQAWGENQCANDKGGEVETDERLTISGVRPGRFDVQLVQKAGRRCVVRGVEVAAGKAYSFVIGDDQLKGCSR